VIGYLRGTVFHDTDRTAHITLLFQFNLRATQVNKKKPMKKTQHRGKKTWIWILKAIDQSKSEFY